MAWRNKHLLWCIYKVGLLHGNLHSTLFHRLSSDVCRKHFWACAVSHPRPPTEQQGFSGLLLPASLFWPTCRILPLSSCLFILCWNLDLALVIVGTAGQAATCSICRTLFLAQLKLCLHLLALLLNPFQTSPTLDNTSFLFLFLLVSIACIVWMDYVSSGMFKDQLLYLHRLHCHSDCRGSNMN